MKISFYSILIIFCFTSCKVTSFGEDQSKALSTQPLPGTVGVFHENIASTNFTEVGVPQLEERIRLSFQKKAFKKRSLRKYNKKAKQEGLELEIIDSIDYRPNYYIIKMSDKIGLIAALNGPENDNLRSFLQATEDNVILSSVRMYFPPETAERIDKASEVYLVNNKKSSYSLELLKKDKSREILEFNEGISFGYEFSAFCWSENYRHEAEIAAFRERNRSCPGETEKDPEKVKKEDLFDKL